MKNSREKCDFLIVGSGASGAVIAARLSENPDYKVVLLEAGGNNNSLLLNLPGLGFAVANNPIVEEISCVKDLPDVVKSVIDPLMSVNISFLNLGKSKFICC